MSQKAYEINFDGLVGLTHNYGGLSHGNMASTSHKNLLSSPKRAALQGLDKMKFVRDLGLKQAVLPPHMRPHVPSMRRLGFKGTDAEVLAQVALENFELLNNCSSASPMWTANAATVSPSPDCIDGRLHITTANLHNKFHRSIEAGTTFKVLQKIFSNEDYFCVHPALPSVALFGDEGAANHTRFCADFDGPGLEFFVFGRYGLQTERPQPKVFPARQTFESCKSIVRQHGIKLGQVVFAQQNPDMIDAGVFHNDVIAVGHQNVFLYHEKAYVDSARVVSELSVQFKKLTGHDLCLIKVPETAVNAEQAVKSYLFNSQIITLPQGQMALISPTECEDDSNVKAFIAKHVIAGDNPIVEVHYLNLKQSMQNGGGPACLRLRVALTEAQITAVQSNVFLTDELYDHLKTWIQKHYRDELKLSDLADPKLVKENEIALDELTQILGLGAIYEFQF